MDGNKELVQALKDLYAKHNQAATPSDDELAEYVSIASEKGALDKLATNAYKRLRPETPITKEELSNFMALAEPKTVKKKDSPESESGYEALSSKNAPSADIGTKYPDLIKFEESFKDIDPSQHDKFAELLRGKIKNARRGKKEEGEGKETKTIADWYESTVMGKVSSSIETGFLNLINSGVGFMDFVGTYTMGPIRRSIQDRVNVLAAEGKIKEEDKDRVYKKLYDQASTVFSGARWASDLNDSDFAKKLKSEIQNHQTSKENFEKSLGQIYNENGGGVNGSLAVAGEMGLNLLETLPLLMTAALSAGGAIPSIAALGVGSKFSALDDQTSVPSMEDSAQGAEMLNAFISGLGEGLTEIPLLGVLKRTLKGVPKEAVQKTLNELIFKRGKQFLSDATLSAGGEVMAGIINNLADVITGTISIDDKEVKDYVLNGWEDNAAMGAFMSGVLGAPGYLSAGKYIGKDENQTDKAIMEDAAISGNDGVVEMIQRGVESGEIDEKTASRMQESLEKVANLSDRIPDMPTGNKVLAMDWIKKKDDLVAKKEALEEEMKGKDEAFHGKYKEQISEIEAGIKEADEALAIIHNDEIGEAEAKVLGWMAEDGTLEDETEVKNEQPKKADTKKVEEDSDGAESKSNPQPKLREDESKLQPKVDKEESKGEPEQVQEEQRSESEPTKDVESDQGESEEGEGKTYADKILESEEVANYDYNIDANYFAEDVNSESLAKADQKKLYSKMTREPALSAREVALRYLSEGDANISKESIARELGLRDRKTGRFSVELSDKKEFYKRGEKSIERIAEDIHQSIPEDLRYAIDEQDIRNEIISLIRDYKTPAEVRKVHIDEYITQKRDEDRAEYEAMEFSMFQEAEEAAAFEEEREVLRQELSSTPLEELAAAEGFLTIKDLEEYEAGQGISQGNEPSQENQESNTAQEDKGEIERKRAEARENYKNVDTSKYFKNERFDYERILNGIVFNKSPQVARRIKDLLIDSDGEFSPMEGNNIDSVTDLAYTLISAETDAEAAANNLSKEDSRALFAEKTDQLENELLGDPDINSGFLGKANDLIKKTQDRLAVEASVIADIHRENFRETGYTEAKYKEDLQKVKDYIQGDNNLGIIDNSSKEGAEATIAGLRIVKHWISRGVTKFKDFLKAIGEPFSKIWKNLFHRGKQEVIDSAPMNIVQEVTKGEIVRRALFDVDEFLFKFQDRYKELYGDIKPTENVKIGRELQTSKAAQKSEEYEQAIFGKGKDSWYSRVKAEGLDPQVALDLMQWEHVPERNLRIRLMNEYANREDLENLRGSLIKLDEAITEAEESLTQAARMKRGPVRDQRVRKRRNDLNNLVKDRDAVIMQIAEKEGYVFDGNYPYSNDDAYRFMNDLKDKGTFDKYAVFTNEFREKVVAENLKNRLESGFIDKEFHDNLAAGVREGFPAWKYYVPMNVDPKFLPPQFAHVQGDLAKGIHALTGKGEMFGPDKRIRPAYMAMVKLKQSVHVGENNKTIVRLKRLIEKAEGSQEYAVIPAGFTMEVSNDGDEIMVPVETKKNILANSIPVRDKGKLYYIFFRPYKDENGKVHKHPVLQTMMRNPAAIEPLLKGVSKGVKAINDFVRFKATISDPNFAVRGIVRDSQDALFNINAFQRDYNLPNVKPRFIQNMARINAGGVAGIVHNKFRSQYVRDLYREAKEQGVYMRWEGFMGTEAEIQQLEKAINDIESSDFSPKKLSKATINVMAYLSNSLEMVPRLAMYGAVRDSASGNGMDMNDAKELAAYAAKNVTLNFEKSGTWGPWLNMVWLFSRPGLAGSRAAYNAMSTTRGKAWFALAISAGYAGAMLRDLWSEDEDFMNYAMNGFADKNYFMFPNPFNPKDPDPIRIPLAYGPFRISNTIGNNIYLVQNGYRKPIHAAIDIMSSIVTVFDPIGGTSSAASLIPTPVTIPFQLLFNMDWKDDPIRFPVRDGRYNFESYNKYKVPEPIARFAAEVFEKSNGLLDLGPDNLYHVYKTLWSGGLKWWTVDLYENISKGIDYIQGKDVSYKADEIPFVKNFYSKIEERKEKVFFNVNDMAERPTNRGYTKKELEYAFSPETQRAVFDYVGIAKGKKVYKLLENKLARQNVDVKDYVKWVEDNK